jgi:hypothetical protein
VTAVAQQTEHKKERRVSSFIGRGWNKKKTHNQARRQPEASFIINDKL